MLKIPEFIIISGEKNHLIGHLYRLLGNQLISLKTSLKRERNKHLSFLYERYFGVAKLLLRERSPFRNSSASR